MEHVIGIGEYKISNNTDDVIKTYALYSCVGNVVYEPIKKVMAMVHIALFDSKFDPLGAVGSPARYANTAIDTLYRTLSLKYYGLRIVNEDVGGRFSRTLIAHVDTGLVEVIKNRM